MFEVFTQRKVQHLHNNLLKETQQYSPWLAWTRWALCLCWTSTMTYFVTSTAALFLLSCKWKRPDHWSLLKVKANMLNRLKWSSAALNPHSRITPLLHRGWPQTRVWAQEAEGGDCTVHWLQHAREGFSFGAYSIHKPHFPCRKCIQSTSTSYPILLRFPTFQQQQSSNEAIPRKAAWKRNCREINSPRKENSLSEILLAEHMPHL